MNQQFATNILNNRQHDIISNITTVEKIEHIIYFDRKTKTGKENRNAEVEIRMQFAWVTLWKFNSFLQLKKYN